MLVPETPPAWKRLPDQINSSATFTCFEGDGSCFHTQPAVCTQTPSLASRHLRKGRFYITDANLPPSLRRAGASEDADLHKAPRMSAFIRSPNCT